MHIDKVSPELAVNVDSIISGTSYIVRGTAVDKPDGTHAGVSKLQYRIDSGAWTDVTIAENWNVPQVYG